MKVPKKVKVGPHLYTIKLVKDLGTEHGKMGLVVMEKSIISIGADLAESQKHDTLIHEILHAIQAQTNFLDTKDDEVEEKGVTRLAALLLQVIQDNPIIFK